MWAAYEQPSPPAPLPCAGEGSVYASLRQAPTLVLTPQCPWFAMRPQSQVQLKR